MRVQPQGQDPCHCQIGLCRLYGDRGSTFKVNGVATISIPSAPSIVITKKDTVWQLLADRLHGNGAWKRLCFEFANSIKKATDPVRRH
jgi:hypothetical protein